VLVLLMPTVFEAAQSVNYQHIKHRFSWIMIHSRLMIPYLSCRAWSTRIGSWGFGDQLTGVIRIMSLIFVFAPFLGAKNGV